MMHMTGPLRRRAARRAAPSEAHRCRLRVALLASACGMACGSVVGPGVSTARAATTVQSASATPKPPQLRSFVRADGSIDLEALRRSGYQGRLDLPGAPIRIDSQQGPVLPPAGEPVGVWSEEFSLNASQCE